ncbi:MAG: TIGR03560 family F420-dependent LLM class oxidoreductase [Anaerolineae bacterium]
MRIGLMLEGQWGLTWARWARLLETAETLGFDCVFRSDHYTIGPPDENSLETFISLTYAADHTSRIEFGPLVAPTTFRQPILTARMAAQIDDLSKGRMVLGMGTGWHEREHRQFGIPFYDVATRYAMLEDALEITTRLYASDDPVSYKGTHYSLDEAVLLPRPSRKGGPPILIGGNGMQKTLPLAARFANEWNGVYLTVSDYRQRMARLDELLDEISRPRTAIKRSMMTQCILGNTDAEVQQKLSTLPDAPDKLLEWNRVVGTPSQVIEHIGQYADAGMERIMLMWRDQEDIAGIELLAKEVLPHFHKG